jgi:hypothetical protein
MRGAGINVDLGEKDCDAENQIEMTVFSGGIQWTISDVEASVSLIGV